MKDLLSIPMGCCERVSEHSNHLFKLCRKVVSNEPKKGKQINILMEGTGFIYHGEIYHKTKDYLYFYLY